MVFFLFISSMLVFQGPGQSTAAPQPRAVEDIDIEVWAETPDITDPVAFCIDDTGRVYVAESFRQEHGVEDNRSQPYWLLDDLAATTIEDRLEKYRKWSDKRANGMQWYTEKEDRVRLLQDSNGDGRADLVKPFAVGFNEVLDGTGAGLIVNGDEVWYTCIPHLWRLQDQDEDGIAELRDPIHSGFGVRDALRGHDMHGLAWGPDGRIYWSIGDRGYFVETDEGRTLSNPRTGAIFRCEPDGSNLEVFCTGLRNPQEIAFDRYGYLFTGDNNSDGGDRARMVYCAEASETGWEMNYQTLGGSNNRGPWDQEGLWRTAHAGRPAWSLPPLAHVGSGPSGFVFYPGQGLSDRYDDHFFMCNFLGGPTNSGVIAMQMVPDGAGFKVEDVHDFVTGILCTDVDFDWDGSMLVSDWVEGWYSTQTGRMLRLTDRNASGNEDLVRTAELVARGIQNESLDVLIELLGHADRRVRRKAHYELAYRGESSVQPLKAVIEDSSREQIARIHALWALGMIARYGDWTEEDASHPLEIVREIAWDDDPEIRAQAARVLGDESYAPAREDLVGLMFDESSRVVYQATMGLGRIGVSEDIDSIIEMLWSNDNEDEWLRHAGVVALSRIQDHERLLELLGDPMPAVRLAAVLALRRLKDPSVALMLRDSDALIAAEAARAIYDVPIQEGKQALADLLPTLLSDGSPTIPDQDVVVEIFEDVGPLGAEDLMVHDVFEGDPDEILDLTGFVMNPSQRDRFVTRMTGRVVPPLTGEYRFALTSDDAAVLHAWPEDEPEASIRLSHVKAWTPVDTWNAEPGQLSKPVHMKAGVPWILDARHSDGTGSDHLAIGWRLPDGTWQRPIGAPVVDRTRQAILRRSLAAALECGDPERIEIVSRIALDEFQSDVIRAEAMEILRQWPSPDPREGVHGRFQQTAQTRPLETWKSAMSSVLPALSTSDEVVAAPAREIAGAHDLQLDTQLLVNTLKDESAQTDHRISMLRLLVRDEGTRSDSIQTALDSGNPVVRSEGLRLKAQWDPDTAVPLVIEAMTSTDRHQRKAGIESAAYLSDDESAQVLADSLENIAKEDSALAMDIVLAARKRDDARHRDLLRTWDVSSEAGYPEIYRLSDAGGDPVKGRELVFYHSSAACLRCHVVEGTGGTAGPSLDGIANRQDSDGLVRSLLEPQAEITEGYGTASAMPGMAQHLDPSQLRDVIAYLKTLRETSE